MAPTDDLAIGGEARAVDIRASQVVASRVGRAAAALLACGALGAARAAPAEEAAQATRPPPALTLEHTQLGIPGMEVGGGANTAASDATALTYRWWWSRGGRAHLGIGLGSLSQSGLGIEGLPPFARAEAGPWLPVASTLTLGMRYRVGDRSTLYADASSARRLAGNAGTDLYAAKVGVEWATPARSRLGFDKGTLGLKFDSGYRMSLRVRHGGIGLYMRGQF